MRVEGEKGRHSDVSGQKFGDSDLNDLNTGK